MRAIPTALALLLAVPAVAAESTGPGDLECWSLGEATGCYLRATQDNLDCLRTTPADGVDCLVDEQGSDTRAYARRACDALTGQACTRP